MFALWWRCIRVGLLRFLTLNYLTVQHQLLHTAALHTATLGRGSILPSQHIGITIYCHHNITLSKNIDNILPLQHLAMTQLCHFREKNTFCRHRYCALKTCCHQSHCATIHLDTSNIAPPWPFPTPRTPSSLAWDKLRNDTGGAAHPLCSGRKAVH